MDAMTEFKFTGSTMLDPTFGVGTIDSDRFISSLLNMNPIVNKSTQTYSGCKCKKSRCIHNKCSCISAGVRCGHMCVCPGCMNCSTDSIMIPKEWVSFKPNPLEDPPMSYTNEDSDFFEELDIYMNDLGIEIDI